MLYNIFYFIKVSIPTVSVSAKSVHPYSTLTVGQSLTLQCEVTTVRGITSGVYIAWNGFLYLDETPSIVNNSQVYTNSYYISQVSTSDDCRVIQCQGIIQTSPSKSIINTLTLDVTGQCILVCSFSV